MFSFCGFFMYFLDGNYRQEYIRPSELYEILQNWDNEEKLDRVLKRIQKNCFEGRDQIVKLIKKGLNKNPTQWPSYKKFVSVIENEYNFFKNNDGFEYVITKPAKIKKLDTELSFEESKSPD